MSYAVLGHLLGIFPCHSHIHSEENEQVYIWRNDDTELYFDKGDIVRFRVENEEWHDQNLFAPPAKGDTTSEIERKVPYSIVVSTCAAVGYGRRIESC